MRWWQALAIGVGALAIGVGGACFFWSWMRLLDAAEELDKALERFREQT